MENIIYFTTEIKGLYYIKIVAKSTGLDRIITYFYRTEDTNKKVAYIEYQDTVDWIERRKLMDKHGVPF